jgi:hypothetical protein
VRQLANSAMKGDVYAQRELLRQYHLEKSSGVAAEEINRFDVSLLSDEEFEEYARLQGKTDTQKRFSKEFSAHKRAVKEALEILKTQKN